MIKIPAPHFVVFYNGVKEYPEKQELRLSDAYQIQEEGPERIPAAEQGGGEAHEYF